MLWLALVKTWLTIMASASLRITLCLDHRKWMGECVRWKLARI